MYDYPRTDPDLGLLSPTTDAIVKALKGRDNILLQPSGGYAANLLGLSDQDSDLQKAMPYKKESLT